MVVSFLETDEYRNKWLLHKKWRNFRGIKRQSRKIYYGIEYAIYICHFLIDLYFKKEKKFEKIITIFQTWFVPWERNVIKYAN